MISRRRFIGTALGAGAAIALPGCQQMGAQSAGKRVIVDSQLHIWTKVLPGMNAQLPEPMTLERLLPILDEGGADRAIIVPPSWQGLSNDYALEAVRRYPRRFGVMGLIDLRDPKSASLLPTWKNQPGMMGIRLTLLGNDAKLLESGTADWLWPAAEKAGVPLQMLAPEQGPHLARIAERHPGLNIILAHMGLAAPVVKAGRTTSAIDQVVALAKYPNVSVMLSATPAYSADGYPFRDFNSHIRRLVEVYGPRRCYWGTDLTNSFTRVTYQQRITHFTEQLDFLSESDKDWVMGRALMERLKWS
jgi:predicted TIM-barrel fold metal-dependent hydrolase